MILGLRSQHNLADLLKVAELSRSTFYYQIKAQQGGDRDAGLKAQIQKIYQRHRGRYGYRRITTELCQTGAVVNHKAVQRLMQAQGLKSLVRPKKYRSYRGDSHLNVPNILERRFQAEKPNQKWVTDVTEFNVKGEKLYLSPVLDLYNGEIVTYQIARQPTFPLVGAMLKKALARLSKEETPVLHSDQGWQYQMSAYRRQLDSHGLIQSMSRKGNCLDNATMESFFGTLESEFSYLQKFTMQQGLHQYIRYYNHRRIKSKLKGPSPVQYRTQPLVA
jgi:transposase InsO family protein